MSSRVLPYYKWFWQDWRSNRRVQRMSYIERGLYRELLDECWIEGSIPDDIDELADICGCPSEVMASAWQTLSGCFVQDGDRWRNQKLDSVRTDQDQMRVKNSENGRKGGIAKSLKEHEIIASAKRLVSDRHIEEKRREEKREKREEGEKKREEGETALQATCREIWKSYAAAYAGRYGVAPVRNAKVNALIKQVARLLPAEEAPAVASHYVQHNGQFYVAKLHPVELLVTDAAKLRTEWATGTTMTATRARQQDRTSSMLAIVEEIKRERGEA